MANTRPPLPGSAAPPPPPKKVTRTPKARMSMHLLIPEPKQGMAGDVRIAVTEYAAEVRLEIGSSYGESARNITFQPDEAEKLADHIHIIVDRVRHRPATVP